MFRLSDCRVEVLRRQYHHVTVAVVVVGEGRRQHQHQTRADHQRRQTPTDGAERHRQLSCHRARRHDPHVSHFTDERPPTTNVRSHLSTVSTHDHPTAKTSFRIVKRDSLYVVAISQQ